MFHLKSKLIKINEEKIHNYNYLLVFKTESETKTAHISNLFSD